MRPLRPARVSCSGRALVLSLGLLLLGTSGTACAGDNGRPAPFQPAPPDQRPVLAQSYRPTGHAAAGDVFVQLFEWSWPEVGAECERSLGPAGYRAALVSPPQEHAVIAGRPWWERYQAVSYSIDRSRSGTRAEFMSMVARCRAAGVELYVDAVVNHMTAGAGTGSNGTVYTKYQYAGVYDAGDFHAPCAVNDYQNAANVQDCELVGLADLNTGRPSVQQRIADYLTSLARLGVAGFRLDAAKHIQPVELDGIIARVNRALTAEGRPVPYLFLEVIDAGSEAVHASDYFGLGYASAGAADVTEFRYRGVGEKFLGTGGQRVTELAGFSQSAWQLMPSDKAVVFLENHDTQRQGGISYLDGDLFRLANIWMLAQPYGYPVVLSGYAFDRRSQAGRDAGPPPGGSGASDGVKCSVPVEAAQPGQWVCEHRDPAIASMVAFRRAVAGTALERPWTDGNGAVAFSRGARGFVALNRGATVVATSVPSALLPGTYCDVLTGGKGSGSCKGATVTVDQAGMVLMRLAANSAIAIHADARP